MADIYYDVNIGLSGIPVNLLPLLDDTDFKSLETAVAGSSMNLRWNFAVTGGSVTQTAVISGSAGNYAITNKGGAMYSIFIPATGGASINNNTVGFGWFSGCAVGILPWRSPMFGFRAAVLNDSLVDGSQSLASASSVALIPTNTSSASSVDQIYTTMASASTVEQIYADMSSVSDVWQNPIRTITSASGLGLASASSLDLIPTTETSASTIWSYAERYLTSASNLNITTTSASTIWNYEARTLTSGSVILSSIVEGSYTLQQWLQILGAFVAGKVTGGGTTEITFRNVSDSLNMIVATVDSNGNRSAITINLS